jgi:predicted Zn-dependent peptidase
MKIKQYDKIKESLYFETLANGLQVFVLPKQGFTKTFVTFSTRFGSNDNHFINSNGDEIRVPDGIAHFLEHKMFAEPDGDVFTKFAANGASANAFTSFDRTAYLFSCSGQLHENLDLLLDFVQHPYFLQENVDKERGIINQEIAMYQDNPDWRLYFGLLSSLFVESPMKIDIAGTSSSIAEITPHNLQSCYDAFYHPSNMCLFAVGSVDPSTFIQWLKDNQKHKTFSATNSIVRLQPSEPKTVSNVWNEMTMTVSQPKCLFGFKELHERLDGRQLLQRECALQLMFQLLFAPSSAIYQSLYGEKLISANFSSSVTVKNEMSYSMIGGDTPEPKQLVSRILKLINQFLDDGVQNVDFERMKRKATGSLIRLFNSPSAIAGQFTAYYFQDSDLFELLPVYESLQLDDCLTILREHIKVEHMSVCVIRNGDQADELG